MDRRSPVWWAWGVYLVVVCLLVVGAKPRSVTPAYRQAAEAWVLGEPLYDGVGTGFIYLPQSAILFIPFNALPYHFGEVAWRILNLACFLWGVRRLAALAALPIDRAQFGIMSLMMGFLAWDAVRFGQTTVLMGGLMMHALADLARQRWSRCALWLCLGFALKPLVVVLILLVGTLYAETRWRLAVGLLLVFLFPFALQQPHYVLEQYQAARHGLGAAVGLAETTYWASLFGVAHVLGFELSTGATLALSSVAALLVLALAWMAKKHLPREQACLILYALAGTYLMLFCPRTENNTYALLGPALALAWAQSWHGRRYWLASTHALLAIGIGSSYELGRWFTPPEQAVWLAPSCCLPFLLLLPTTYGLFCRAASAPFAAARGPRLCAI